MNAIKIIEAAKKTHEHWRDYYKKNPESQNTETHQYIGDRNDHEKYIKNYEQVIAEIKQLQKLLCRSEYELKKTCSCCHLFKDCHLPCKVNDLRTDIEQALKETKDAKP